MPRAPKMWTEGQDCAVVRAASAAKRSTSLMRDCICAFGQLWCKCYKVYCYGYVTSESDVSLFRPLFIAT